MVQQIRSIESSGADVESAIAAGLAQLGVAREQVTVEVIQQPSRGVLGIGSRDALVRLTASGGTQPAAEKLAPPPAAARPQPRPAPAPEPKPEREPEPDLAGPQAILERSREVLSELLDRMQVDAEIEGRVEPSNNTGDEDTYILNLRGQDLSFLIGRKGETLAAVQHVARLIINKEAKQRVNLLVDIEGYKARREKALRKLALRIAEQATRRNRRIALEPMNAYERRIIHLALRNHPTVVTESVGELDRRKVTILPKAKS